MKLTEEEKIRRIRERKYERMRKKYTERRNQFKQMLKEKMKMKKVNKYE